MGLKLGRRNWRFLLLIIFSVFLAIILNSGFGSSLCSEGTGGPGAIYTPFSLSVSGTNLGISTNGRSCSECVSSGVTYNADVNVEIPGIGYSSFSSYSSPLWAFSDTVDLRPYPSGTYQGTVTLDCTYFFKNYDVIGYTGSKQSSFTWTNLPAPTVTISENPTSITSGSSSTLSWSSTNANSCTASGGWSGSKATSGSQSVSPTQTTTYTLTCTGSGGSATNSATVTVSQPPPPSCGNGICGTGENYTSCPQDCQLTGSRCGDGLVNVSAGEQCDPGPPLNLNGQTCQSRGFTGGTLSCTNSCTFDTSACTNTTTTQVCGNGVREGTETCDDGNTVSGDGCSFSCQTETGWSCTGSVCTPICGDGRIVDSEECDGTNLNGQTCQSFGYTGGTLSCTSSCTFNTNACTISPPPPSCTLNSASWSTTSAVEGQIVSFSVATTNCQGQILSFEIKERDTLSGDDPVMVNPSNAVIPSGGTVVKNWTAEWQSDPWPETDPPEYYFRATLVSSGTNIRSSNELNVYQQAPLMCDGVVTCSSYSNQQDCGNDICSVAANGVPSSVDCSDPNTACSCSWNTNTSVCETSWTTSDNTGSDIGTCYYTETTTDTCEDDGYLTVNLIATWVWDTACGSSCQAQNQGLAAKCQSSTEVFQCPAQIPLPFFSFYNLLAALVLIAVIYWAISLRKKGKRRRKR